MVFRYKVTLAGIKGFHRIYDINGDSSLYTFHRQLQSDLELPQDQLIVFKALDAGGGVVGRYGLFDLGSGTVDKITVRSTVAAGIASFVYFYDVANKKSVRITLEGEEEDAVVDADSPVLVDSKGPEPLAFENGYVAYEDLPEEVRNPLHGGAGERDDEDDLEDDEDEEDDDDDEEGEVIYDGSESF